MAAAIEDVAARFWAAPEDQAVNRHDLQAVRRSNVATAFAALGIDDAALSIEIADSFSNKRRQEHSLLPDAMTVLEGVRSLGLKIGLVTNGGTIEQREKISRFRLGGPFDYIAISEEVGFAKPDPAIFRHALAALRVSAVDTWMIGDNLAWDVQGAQSAGLVAVWLNADHATAPDGIQPDHIVSDLPGILTLLRTA